MIPLKAILLETRKEGVGLHVIRKYENTAIDISNFDTSNAPSDPTCCSGGYGRIIKDNRVYRIEKTYMDIDKNVRWLLAVREENSCDIV